MEGLAEISARLVDVTVQRGRDRIAESREILTRIEGRRRRRPPRPVG
jgi:hypothetical protein